MLGTLALLIPALVLACVVVGAALALGALGELRHALLLWRARRVAAQEILRTDAVIVDVRGKIALDQPLLTPLTSRACAHWFLVVSRADPQGRGTDGQPDLLVFQDARPFWVDDGTGRVRVDAKSGGVPISEVKPTTQPVEKLNAALDALLTVKLHAPAAMWCHGRTVTAVEHALCVGDEVSLVARRERSPNRLDVTPLHVTLGRARVVALRTMMRAAVIAGAAAAFFFVAGWLR